MSVEIVNHLKKMKKIRLITGLALMQFGIAFGQNSLLEDNMGEGALKVNHNRVALNTSEESIKIDYFSGSTLVDVINTYSLTGPAPSNTLAGCRLIKHDTIINAAGVSQGRLWFHPEPKYLWGLNLNAKANNGVTSVLDGDKITFAGSAGAYLSIYIPASEVLDYIDLSAALLSGKVDLLDTANILAGSHKESYLGFRAEAAYNRYGSLKGSTTIFGISTSFKMSDNADELGRKEYNRTTTIISSPTEFVTQQNKVSGFIQEQYDENQQKLTLNVDLGIYPHKTFRDRVLLAAHIRAYSKEMESPVASAGVGAYLTKDGAPSKILGGINFILQDLFETVNTAPFQDRIAINIVAGVRF